MRPRERRFIGTARQWQVTCSKCGAASKVIKAKRTGMPPAAVIKKLLQIGWMVGDKSKDDVCPNCVRERVKSKHDLAARALKDVQAPVVPVNGHQVHFTELKAAAAALDPKSAKELIEVLRRQIPKPVPRAKPEPAPQLTPSEYEAWLDGLTKP